MVVGTMAVGICGTDIEICDGDYGIAPPSDDRLVIGDKSLGRVLAAPSGSGFDPGALVVGFVRRPHPVPCPSCAIDEWGMCRDGRAPNAGSSRATATRPSGTGIDPMFAVKVDPALGDLGVLVEPASVVAKTWDHIERIGGPLRGVVAAIDEGIRAAIEIRRRGHATPLLLFSQYIGTTRAIELLRTGSSGFGYLLKDRVLDVDDFLDAVRRVAHGGTAIDPLIVAALVGAGDSPDLLASLSPRELDVLRLMAEGLTNTAISDRLHLARRTVETHVRGVFTKLHLVPTLDDHRRVQAVLAYLRHEA